MFSGAAASILGVSFDSKRHAAGSEAATETDIPASGGIHSSLHAQGAGHRAGKHCTSPVTCEFFDHCNPPLPDDHIGYLPRIHASAVEELEEMGVESIHEYPTISN